MFNYEDMYRKSRILNPMAVRQRMNSSQIQDSSSYGDDYSKQFQDVYKSSSETLTNAEKAADRRGGLFFSRDNAEKYMNAIDANENAPRPRMQALAGHLDKQPTREQYEPSRGGKLAAALTGFGVGYTEGPSKGIAAAKSQMDSPYEDARQSWQDRTGPLEYSANLEEKGINDRSAALTRHMTMGKQFSDSERAWSKEERDAEAQKKSMALMDARIADLAKNKFKTFVPDGKTGKMLGVYEDGTTQPTDITSMDYTAYMGRRQDAAAGRAISQQNANTASRQADTAQASLAERTANDAKLNPSEQLAASRLALKDLSQYAEYQDFIDANGDLNTLNKDMNVDSYADFIHEYRQRMQKYLNQSRIPRERNY